MQSAFEQKGDAVSTHLACIRYWHITCLFLNWRAPFGLGGQPSKQSKAIAQKPPHRHTSSGARKAVDESSQACTARPQL